MPPSNNILTFCRLKLSQILKYKRENEKSKKALPGWLNNMATYHGMNQKQGYIYTFAKYVDFVAHKAGVLTKSLRDLKKVRQPLKLTTERLLVSNILV